MPRAILRQAIEENNLTQAELADRVGVQRTAVSRWIRGVATPNPHYRRQVEIVLNRVGDKTLFDLSPSDSSIDIPVTKSAQQSYIHNCTDVSRNVTMSSTSDSSDIQQSELEDITDMDKGKRNTVKTVGTIAAGTIAAASGIVPVDTAELYVGPMVEPRAYLSQCRLAIDDAWDWLNQGNYRKVARNINAHITTLERFAAIGSPFRQKAARYMVETIILQIILAKHRLDFVDCDAYCKELSEYGEIAGDNAVLALALDWQGETYDSFYHQPSKAIPIFHNALSHADDDALLKSTIFMDLSNAYSQDSTQDGYEQNARKYSELAHLAFPVHPESNPFYRCIGFSSSELFHFDGIVYLNLANNLHSRDYAQMALDTFEKSLSEKVMSAGNSCSLLIRQGDASLALGDLNEGLRCLTGGYTVGVKIGSIRELTRINDVLHRIPDKWQKESSVQELQKEVDNALTVARA